MSDSNKDFNEKFRERLLKFTIAVFQFLDRIPSSNNKRIIAYQLGKSASSTGANFRAFCRGRSKREKFAKICIVVEEADETEYWLKVLDGLNLGVEAERQQLLKEIDEIIRVVVTIKHRLHT
jgi:four helix bundle protein